MNDIDHQRGSFEKTARAMGIDVAMLARDSHGNYVQSHIQKGWDTWQVEVLPPVLPPEAVRRDRILAVFYEHGSCRENDEADHISFANAILDEFIKKPTNVAVTSSS